MNLPDIDSLWNYADPASSEQAFLGVLSAARADNDREYLAQLLTQLARSQVLLRRYEEGHSTLDEAERLLSNRTPVARVRCLLERGRAWNDTGRTEEARKVFEEAFRLAVAERFEVLAVDAAHMLGMMEPFEDAVQWNRRAIGFAEGSQEPRARRWLGTLHINLGWNYQRLADYAAAEQTFASAIPHLESMGNAARIRSARTCLARNRRLMGDAAGALTLLEPLLAEIQAAGRQDGYALEEIAECLLALGRNIDAQPYFARAYAALSTYAWFPPNETARLQRLKEFGGLV